MPKLYVFGIGGTGARVIKSLTMLLAAGCKLGNGFSTVVPILIDPDSGNGDLNRTKEILKLYQEIRKEINQPEDFFAHEMKTVANLANKNAVINPDHFLFKLSNVDGNSFASYMGFNSLSNNFQNAQDDQNFLRLFYSDKNLKANLNVGFKGNPNMGSIVLDQFTNSPQFNSFTQSFGQGDAVFIISSIFGGTGAAGFPLLLKTLRNFTNTPGGGAAIGQAKIGAISYLPYFSLNQQGDVKSNTFLEKTKIALEYYNRTIINTNKINSIYFLGDDPANNVLNYADGGMAQKNEAHFLELVGALSVFDFCSQINNLDGQAIVKEYGVAGNPKNISFTDLAIGDYNTIGKHLKKYKLFTEYLQKGLLSAINVSRWTKSNIKLVKQNQQSPLDENYFKSSEYQTQIKPFNNYFDEWLIEMESNKPSFAPFNHVTKDNPFEYVKNKAPKGGSSFTRLDTANCEYIEEVGLSSGQKKAHHALIKLFEKTTEEVLLKKNIL